jgi:hypothetical protein
MPAYSPQDLIQRTLILGKAALAIIALGIALSQGHLIGRSPEKKLILFCKMVGAGMCHGQNTHNIRAFRHRDGQS